MSDVNHVLLLLGSENRELKERIASLEAMLREKEESEAALRESERKYREIFDATPEAIFIGDALSAKILDVNEAMLKMYGLASKEEAIAKGIDGLSANTSPYTLAEAQCRKPLAVEGPTQVFEWPAKKETGELFWVEVAARGTMIGGEDRLLAFVRDISERKLAETKLRMMIAQINEAQHIAGIGSWVMRLDSALPEWSDEMFRIFGVCLQDGVPSYPEFRRLIHPDDLPLLDEAVTGALARGRGYSLELRIIRSDGLERIVHQKCEIFTETESRDQYFLGTSEDITERKRVEEEQRRLQEQLLQAQKMESVGRLAGGVAHDFNNMLSVILGHAELAMTKVEATDPLHHHLQEIRKAGKHSADLTGQLLAFARKQTVAPRVLNLNDTVAGMLEMLRRLIGEDIDLAWMPGADLWPVRIDPAQIDQILANLSVNARDAIADVGKVTIETANVAMDEAYCADQAGLVPGEYVLLAVSDDGCGIDKAMQEYLFEPFFTTKEVGKGTGLGLATVYGIVKQNQGFINVYSELGEGATFKIYLRRYVGKAAQIHRAGLAEVIGRGRETVLLVEDDPAVLDVGRMMLEDFGYRVLVANTPGKAIRMAEEHAGTIDLLMTDVVMPEMNGRDLARRLLSLYPDLKRLFMSGYTADVISYQGVLEEGVDFIQKPFSMQALAAKVREVLDQNRMTG